jgi:hypothetical protein
VKFIIWRPSVESPTDRVMPAKAGIQYAAARRLITDIGNYWIIRFRG